MRTKIYSTLIAVSLIGAVLTAAGSSEQLTRDKCGTCHKLDKLCKNLGAYDKAGWAKIINSMKIKGAIISDSEKEEVSAYLAGLKPGAKPVCQ